MRRMLARAMLTSAVALAVPVVVHAQGAVPGDTVPGDTVPGDPIPGDTIPGDSVPAATTPGTLPLLVVPSGCTAPPRPDIVFVGTLVERDFRTGRFRIDQVRAGSEEPFAVDGLIDVRYGIDVDYLEIGTDYLVSAMRDPVIGVLASKIRPPAPLFGGDDVVGVAESDVECPQYDDPIRTFLPDGSSIDSAVLAPLRESRTPLVAAFAIPLAVAFGIVFVIALLRWGITGLLRGAVAVVRHPSR